VRLGWRGDTLDDALGTVTRAYDLQAHRDGAIIMLGTAASMNRRYANEEGSFGTRTVVLQLRYAAPDDFAKALQEALPQGTLVVADRRTSAVVVSGSAETIDRARRLLVALDGTPQIHGAAGATTVLPLRFLKPSEAIKALKGLVPETGLIPDDRQNAIVVAAAPDVTAAARALVTSLDVPSRQVTFEVRVADVTPTNATSNVGLIFGGVSVQGDPTVAAASTTFVRGSIAVNATLNALVEEGHASILSEPRLTTLNNREADMLVGSSYPVVYFDARTGTQQVQFVDIGVKLRLTPTIGDDGTITAELHPEYSQITGFQQGFPIIGSRKVNATLRVRDGETIVLAGLLSDFTTDTVQKIPGLGDLPVLGGFFRNRSAQHQRDEIVFLITPHIVNASKG
jgi:type II secretory pathway component GspD/PulD (secretin)